MAERCVIVRLMRQAPKWHRLSLRTQMLLAVNIVLALAAVVLIITEGRRAWRDGVAQKQYALQQGADTLLPAIQRLASEGVEAIQAHIDEVCVRLERSETPGHYIVVRWQDQQLEARAHHGLTPGLADTLDAVARDEGPVTVRGQQLLVATASEDLISVSVAEDLADVRRAVWGEVLRRLGGLLLLGLIGGVVVNLVLLRLVARPMERLVQTVRRIGSGALGSQASASANHELSLLSDELNRMSRDLAAAGREQRQQLDKAVRIQRHLLPRDTSVPGLLVVVHHEPATEVAGDYYDIIPAADGSWLLCVADVTGHGIPAAMGAAKLKTVLLAVAERTTHPGEILRDVNRWLNRVLLPEDFASVWLGRWEPAASRLTYASAGHEPAFLLRDGECCLLPSTGTLLGIFENERWESEAISFRPGERLLVYTDGLVEAESNDGQPFSRERAQHIFDSTRELPLSDSIDQFWQAVRQHISPNSPTDDLTCLGLEGAISSGDRVPVVEANDRISAL
jgi:phosphoserine phosphatase RsbU/P